MYQVFEKVDGKFISIVSEDGFPKEEYAFDFIDSMKQTFRHKNSDLYVFKLVENPNV